MTGCDESSPGEETAPEQRVTLGPGKQIMTTFRDFNPLPLFHPLLLPPLVGLQPAQWECDLGLKERIRITTSCVVLLEAIASSIIVYASAVGTQAHGYGEELLQRNVQDNAQSTA